ncbi:MAG TPA: recombinase-like helix-turn-helix domain-containing protein, partial [Burkholderiaceae bacterium]|nr:recombinase-like helix-turn-helix domain-containing protein [Burkholderiaceae bacterium]
MFEDLLGDAIERAFGEGAHTLPELVAHLNRTGPASENGGPWTEQNFQALMARLGT